MSWPLMESYLCLRLHLAVGRVGRRQGPFCQYREAPNAYIYIYICFCFYRQRMLEMKIVFSWQGEIAQLSFLT